MRKQLIISGNAVYELDLECREKKLSKNPKRKQNENSKNQKHDTKKN